MRGNVIGRVSFDAIRASCSIDTVAVGLSLAYILSYEGDVKKEHFPPSPRGNSFGIQPYARSRWMRAGSEPDAVQRRFLT